MQTHRLSIEQFLATKDSPEVAALAEKFNGGAFMNCHCIVFAQTGIWIQELVPVFRKLDAHLAVTNEKTVKHLSP